MATNNDQARDHGIPKWLRQHAARYGVGVDQIVQTHQQFRVPTLDHWRDRDIVAYKAGLPTSWAERSEWQS